MAQLYDGSLNTCDSLSGWDAYLECGFSDQTQFEVSYFWVNSSGLNFRFHFKEVINDIFVEDICELMSSKFKYVYPFEAAFASVLSTKICSTVMGALEFDHAPGRPVYILIEWKSFAMLILSSNISSSADIKLHINSKKYSIHL